MITAILFKFYIKMLLRKTIKFESDDMTIY